MKREIKKYRYVFAAFFTLVLFSSGMLFSNLVDDYRSSKLDNQFREDITDLKSQSLQMEYLQTRDNCESLENGLSEVIKNYNSRLERVVQYEESSLIKSERFHDIRNRYFLSGIEYWMFAQKVRDKCENYNPNTVLYFTEQDCEKCADTGESLSRLKKSYGSEILVFIVYSDVNDGMAEILRKEYDVEKMPTVVLNESKKFEGTIEKSEIEDEIS